MREILDQLGKWFDAGEQVALAQVVSTWGSSPRPVGSSMGVSSGSGIAGSVSGGCVEGAVVEAALEILKGAPARLLHFGVADETAWGVGLACGGSIEVFVTQLSEDVYRRLRSDLQSDKAPILATLIGDPADEIGKTLTWSDKVPGELQASLHREVDILTPEHPERASASEGQQEWFLNPIAPAPRLIIIGGVHISVALVAFAKPLGYETIIVDPRRLFASSERFPNVDRLIQRWPEEALQEVGLHASTAVAVLTHDPKIDDPAVITALASQAFYIGVLGSRKTHAKRLERLREAGLDDQALNRLHAPIGIDIAAQTPEEIALSIMAEIIARRNQQAG
jgi:xanthine dehydrogenase accessory factor